MKTCFSTKLFAVPQHWRWGFWITTRLKHSWAACIVKTTLEVFVATVLLENHEFELRFLRLPHVRSPIPAHERLPQPGSGSF